MKVGNEFRILIAFFIIVLILGGTGAFLFATNIEQGVVVKEEIKNEAIAEPQELGSNIISESKMNDLENTINELDNKINGIESRVNNNENELNNIKNKANIGLVSFLFGAFCALWAQNSNRSSWLWFFAGLIFNVFAVIALLIKNSEDKAEKI